MSLHGTLDTLSIPEILAMLEFREKTGALVVDGNFGSGTLYFKAGKLVAAEAPDLLISPESDAQFEALLIDVCFELLRQERGAFDFKADVLAEWERDNSFSIQDVLKAAQAAVDDWASISSVVPDMNVSLALAPNLSVAKITFNAAAWEIIAAIDGYRGITQLAAITEQSRIEVARALLSFIEMGAVVVADVPSESVVLEDENGESSGHADTDIAEALIASLTDMDASKTESDTPSEVESKDSSGTDPGDEAPETDQEKSASNRDRGALLRMFSSLREP